MAPTQPTSHPQRKLLTGRRATLLASVAGLGIAIFPDIVPFRLSLWAAASSTLSHVFLLIGAALVTPVVLAYSAFSYRVFRGKTPAEGWEL